MQRQNTLLDRTVDDKSTDVDGAGLADTVCSVGCLILRRGVPSKVEGDDLAVSSVDKGWEIETYLASCSQVQTGTTRLPTDEHDARRVLVLDLPGELSDDVQSVGLPHTAVVDPVLDALVVEEYLNELEVCDELGENDYLDAVFGEVLVQEIPDIVS